MLVPFGIPPSPGIGGGSGLVDAGSDGTDGGNVDIVDASDGAGGIGLVPAGSAAGVEITVVVVVVVDPAAGVAGIIPGAVAGVMPGAVAGAIPGAVAGFIPGVVGGDMVFIVDVPGSEPPSDVMPPTSLSHMPLGKFSQKFGSPSITDLSHVRASGSQSFCPAFATP